MKRKGFTLIELLAVIVILAIIVLIAIPIILNVIGKTKKEANNRSIELYKSALEDAFLRNVLTNDTYQGVYTSDENGEVLTSKDESTTVTVQYTGNRVVCKDISYLNGKINADNCSVIEGNIDNNTDEEEKIGSPAPETTPGSFENGDAYNIKVSDDLELLFYVIGTNSDGTVNLILSRNMGKDGNYATAGTDNVAWINATDYAETVVPDVTCDYDACNNKGPITAIKFIEETTSNTWTKVPKFDYTYEDENGKYLNQIERKGIKARLPRLSEVRDNKCEYGLINSCELYISSYLAEPTSIGINSGPFVDFTTRGYWTSSSAMSQDNKARYVSNNRSDTIYKITNATYFGVRPVITIPKEYIS